MKATIPVKDHSVSKEDFVLEYDSTYHMYTTSPRPSLEKLPFYYESEDYISHTDSKRSLFERMYQMVKGITLSRKQKLLKRFHPSLGSVLDIGAGTGDFLEYLLKSDWHTQGVEPNESARNRAQEKGLVLRENIDVVTDSFDVITMWHVLEHVYDLEKQIAWLKAHLTKEGTLFIAVPNFESHDAQHYGSQWAAYDVPRHLYHFSEESIKKLFLESGLKVIGTEPMKFDAYYVSFLSEKYRSGKMNFLRALRVGWVSNRKAKTSGAYSSLIYIIKHI